MRLDCATRAATCAGVPGTTGRLAFAVRAGVQQRRRDATSATPSDLVGMRVVSRRRPGQRLSTSGCRHRLDSGRVYREARRDGPGFAAAAGFSCRRVHCGSAGPSAARFTPVGGRHAREGRAVTPLGASRRGVRHHDVGPPLALERPPGLALRGERGLVGAALVPRRVAHARPRTPSKRDSPPACRRRAPRRPRTRARSPCPQSENRHLAASSAIVGEALVDLVAGDRGDHLAHAWRVDDRAAAGQRDELAVRGRVTALAVGPSRADGEQLGADQQVRQRRLAAAGLPQEDDRPAR